MGEIDGIKLLEILRKDKKIDIPFIILTGKGDETVAMEALNKGADQYFRKINRVKENFSLLARAIIDEIKKYQRERREEFICELLRHDLSNKLQNIGFYHELIREMDVSKEEKDEYLEKAEEVTQRALNTIKKVRTLRKVEEEEITKLNINKIIDKVVNEIKPHASRKGIGIERKKCSFSVMGSLLLEDLFSNLLENSIKYSEGKKVQISCKRKNDNIIITIEDDGKGIPDKIKGKIFDKGFKKGKEAGSGLGLYLVKEIAENYNGKVEVKDSDLGGARFDVYLKKA